eukprot:scaffold127020_cov29-Prasinocladus_malaysianus.AAC.1
MSNIIQDCLTIGRHIRHGQYTQNDTHKIQQSGQAGGGHTLDNQLHMLNTDCRTHACSNAQLDVAMHHNRR